MSSQQCWVVVASRDYALSGVAQKIVQVYHGKLGPLRQMQSGDGLLFMRLSKCMVNLSLASDS